jgi:hypothetical protein
MRRFFALATIAMLLVAVASPVNAGYLIIRIILEGGSGGAEVSPAGPGSLRPGGFPGSPGSPGSPSKPGGSGSGPPGGGMSGPGSIFPGGSGGAHGPPAVPAHLDPSRSIVVVVPVEEDLAISTPFYYKRGANPDTNPAWKPKLHSIYRGEKYVTNLFTDSESIQWYENLLQWPTPKKTRVSEVKEIYLKWAKTKSDPEILLTAVNAALGIGLMQEAIAYADELLAVGTEKPDGLPAIVATFVAAYGKMQKGIKGDAIKPSKADYWKQRLGAQNVRTQHHYSLISWDATEAEAKRRLEILEENFKAFFLWHASRGIELPIPDAPLIVVLPKHAGDVIALAKVLDLPHRLTADGFYSSEHELLVLSPERMDEVGLTFVRQTQQMYQAGVSREKLLAGDGPALNARGNNAVADKDGKKPDEVARMQTTALVERLAEDAAIVCSVSREGSRQLLYATHQFPKYVDLPEWLTNGVGNFYTRPKEPAFITRADNKPLMNIATATGYGIPNYALQRYFKDLFDKGDLNPDRAALVRNILTDAYFHGLRDSKDSHDPDPPKIDASAGIALNSGGPSLGTAPGFGQGPGSASGPGGPPGGLKPPGAPNGGGSSKPPQGMGGGKMPRPPGSLNPGSSGFGGAPPSSKEEEDLLLIARKKRERLAIKAQATSWALYYYLAKARPAELHVLLSELALMPRDVPLEGSVLVAFCRALNLDGSPESLNGFARSWLEYMHELPAAGVDIVITEPKPPTPTQTSGPGMGGPLKP